MNIVNRLLRYFSRGELALWGGSAGLLLISFFLFDRSGGLALLASLIGVTSLIFCAKGNPIGQVLMILFSLLYGYISFSVHYYGEMLTYLGMTLPMSAVSLVSWLRHPFNGCRSQVQVDRLRRGEWRLLLLLTAGVTAAFYFLLAALHTANLLPSTLSVATSFAAAYLTFRRSPYLSVGYAANDVVLILLWILAVPEDIANLNVVFCFAAFLANDIYCFISWRRMAAQQAAVHPA